MKQCEKNVYIHNLTKNGRSDRTMGCHQIFCASKETNETQLMEASKNKCIKTFTRKNGMNCTWRISRNWWKWCKKCWWLATHFTNCDKCEYSACSHRGSPSSLYSGCKVSAPDFEDNAPPNFHQKSEHTTSFVNMSAAYAHKRAIKSTSGVVVLNGAPPPEILRRFSTKIHIRMLKTPTNGAPEDQLELQNQKLR